MSTDKRLTERVGAVRRPIRPEFGADEGNGSLLHMCGRYEAGLGVSLSQLFGGA